MSFKDQSTLSATEVRCGICQHSVLVRGIDLVACLTHLDMRDPEIGRVCVEYEPKAKGHGPANEASPVPPGRTQQAESE